jgi:hypothetical protein
MYGGTHLAMAGNLMGLNYDSDGFMLETRTHTREPEIPAVLMPHFVSKGITEPKAITEEMANLCKKFAYAFNTTFPFCRPIIAELKAVWEQGYTDTGFPTPMECHGYVNKPMPFKEVKEKTQRVRFDYLCPADRKTVEGHVTVYSQTEASKGTPAGALKYHMQDAHTCRGVINRLGEQSVECITIHDAFLTWYTERNRVQHAYNHAFGETHGRKIPEWAEMIG